MASCCIIGGGGFIGTNLARHLAATGWRIRTFGHASRFAGALPAGDHRTGDLADGGRLAAAVEECDVVYHLVGGIDLPATERRAAERIEATLQDTLGLLDLARRGAFGRLVFLSSGGTVYGPSAVQPVPEDAPQWPISSYGVGKLAIERYLHVHHHLHGIDYRIARLSNPFGRYQRPDRGQGAVAAMIMHGLRGTAFPLMGDGRVVRDYLPVGDAVSALARLAGYRGGARVFNVGSGIGRTLLEMAALVEVVLGRPLTVERRPGRSLDVPVNVLDISRARAELDWAPEIPVEAALRETADWQAGCFRG